MARQSKENHALFLLIVGLSAWAVPGAGYFLLKENRRATIVLTTIVLTFLVGIYIGSIGIIDPVGAKLWYVAQIMTSPVVAALGYLAAGGGYPVYGKPNEIGQIYTSVAGLLNFLCIVNSVYLAHLYRTDSSGG